MSTGRPTIKLGNLLTDIQPGFASGRHNSDGEGIPHFRPMNISTHGRIERTVMKYVDPSAGRPEVRLRRGDILFNNTNSPELVGKTALFDEDGAPAYSNHMTRLRVNEARLDPRYAALRLHQAWREGWFAAHCNNHVSQASIGREVLKTLEIELPSLEVQRAIVSLNAGIEVCRQSASSHLTAARHSIDRFRRSVLIAACSGRLTADWREISPTVTIKLRPLKKRRTRRLETFDQTTLEELPESWQWVQLDNLLPEGGIFDGPFGSNLKTADYTSSGARVVRLENIGHLKFIGNKQTFVSPEKYSVLQKHAVFPDDIVFSSFVDQRIRVCVLPDDLDDQAIAKADCFTLRPIEQIDCRYLALQLASPHTFTYLASNIHGATRPRVNTTQLRGVPIRICAIEEQREIVRRFDNLWAHTDAIERRIDSTAKAVKQTSQAVLAKAFRGDLSSSTTFNASKTIANSIVNE